MLSLVLPGTMAVTDLDAVVDGLGRAREVVPGSPLTAATLRARRAPLVLDLTAPGGVRRRHSG